MIRTLTALSLMLMAATATAANAKDYSAQYDQCLSDAGATNNTSVLDCSSSVSASVKSEINALYGKLHARLAQQSQEDADKLEQTQKAWLVYRNGQCDLATSYVGSPMFGYCPMLLNIQRADELREMLGD
ncbi:MAG: lysozyme inhibitor LprI family protein [Achromobacter pestifer]